MLEQHMEASYFRIDVGARGWAGETEREGERERERERARERERERETHRPITRGGRGL